jgi:hypothetical protein
MTPKMGLSMNRMLMKRFGRPLVLVLICALGWLGLNQYRSWMACKRRGEQFDRRAEQLKRDAGSRLKLGTKKNDVMRFFAENGISVTFTQSVDKSFAIGTIYTFGCARFSLVCGSDSALNGGTGRSRCGRYRQGKTRCRSDVHGLSLTT